jgi:hypothetical protein
MVGLYYLKTGVERLCITQKLRHIVTREPSITLMFVTQKSEADPVGVSILINSCVSNADPFWNSKACTSMPSSDNQSEFLRRCSKHGRSNEEINESTVVTAVLIQLMSREYMLSLSNWKMPNPYDPEITKLNWAKYLGAQSKVWLAEVKGNNACIISLCGLAIFSATGGLTHRLFTTALNPVTLVPNMRSGVITEKGTGGEGAVKPARVGSWHSEEVTCDAAAQHGLEGKDDDRLHQWRLDIIDKKIRPFVQWLKAHLISKKIDYLPEIWADEEVYNLYFWHIFSLVRGRLLHF